MTAAQILIGDVREQLARIPSNSVDCCVTSPPYWGLRDYGVIGQIGLEPTLGEHLAVMVEVFREVRRVLKAQGTCWLNYGDCYAAAPNGKSVEAYKADGSDDRTFRDKPFSTVGPIYDPNHQGGRNKTPNIGGISGKGQAPSRGAIVAGGFLKPKDLCMIPNRLAIALQDDGWYVRSEIIWHKPNPMPESVYDRPTTAHEKIWLLSKGEDYFYNHAAIREPVTGGAHARRPGPNSRQNVDRVPVPRKGKTAAAGSGIRNNESFSAAVADIVSDTKNARNVWTIAPKPFREAHFATFPPALAERCVKAGCPTTVCGYCGATDGCGAICATFDRKPGVVLDPFGGAGTVGLVAEEMGLGSILIELNPEYAAIADRRIAEARTPITKGERP
ncbi:DNA-methyltransferase [Sphingomonas sp. PAMC 26621]|uniref:DNA-methyltransferase n=1 Tax=Sphingomonas sp. PAMC 26621 TaxID=1112213 RepID=UPI000287CF8D|nr:site-specific DNA-methyltransferase [Sphingomonas sp. PAMC 26621]